AFFIASVAHADNGGNAVMWFAQPAAKWDAEGLPIGNGRMGAMMMGGVDKDIIQFNEQSLWSGDNNWDGAYETGDHGFGSYRNFGEVEVDFNQSGSVSNYKRRLDLFKAVYNVSFNQNGIEYQREAFASHPDQVMVFKYTTKGKLSGHISLSAAQGAKTEAENGSLLFAGIMPNQLKYAAKLIVQHEGGSVAEQDGQLVFTNCRSITLYLNARTNYKPDYNAGWRGTDPLPVLEKELMAAVRKDYRKLLSAHIKDFIHLSAAASIHIGSTPDSLSSLPIDIRRGKYAAGAIDPGLEAMVFQYGRYL